MNGAELESRFERLAKRHPTAEETLLLLKIQKEFEIRDDDPLWMILIILEHYRSLYEEIPDRINLASANALEALRAQMRQGAVKELVDIISYIRTEVVKSIKATELERAKADRRSATGLAAVGLAVFGMFVGICTYAWGYMNGKTLTDEATLFAASPQGQFARQMSEQGVLTLITRCPNDGVQTWIMEDGTVQCLKRNRWIPVGRIDPDLSPPG